MPLGVSARGRRAIVRRVDLEAVSALFDRDLEFRTIRCVKDEALIVIPGNNAHRKELLALEGSKVIMKPSGRLAPIQEELRDLQLLDKASMIERCGLPGERVYEKAADAKETGYFAVLLVK